MKTRSCTLRPRYHLMPAKNWINDPNGPIYWRGRYRMFFQHNPTGPLWGNIHWGYAHSKDMVRWTVSQDALAPGPDAYDALGVFSGSACEFGGRLLVYYTGNAPQTQCLAYMTDLGSGSIRMQKSGDNPIISVPPSELETEDFRDPFVWQDAEGLRMLLASGHGGEGLVLSYRSEDGIKWCYEGIYYREPLPVSVPAFECPLFFSLGGVDFLVLSPFDTPVWISGEGGGSEFIPARKGTLDSSKTWYAPNTFLAADGRRILVGWLREERPDSYLESDGWAGCLSLPREAHLLPDGTLGQRPVAELELLRRETIDLPDLELRPGSRITLAREFSQGELQLSIEGGVSAEFEVAFLEGEGGRALLKIRGAEIVLDCSRTGPDPDIRPEPKRLTLSKARNQLSLRIFIDHSTVEVFVEDSYCLSSRAYPLDGDTGSASLLLVRGSGRLLGGKVHRMADGIEYGAASEGATPPKPEDDAP